MPFAKTVFIERSDFRESDSADYFRLAPGKTVGLLKVPFPITATTFKKDPVTGLVTEIHATYGKSADGGARMKPKGSVNFPTSLMKYHIYVSNLAEFGVTPTNATIAGSTG